jgi:hypothetical protein
MNDDENDCWICLGKSADIIKPCKCPRYVHPLCLARWQIENIGTSEEIQCRFCNDLFPSWKNIYTLQEEHTLSPISFKVICMGIEHKLNVVPNGFERFKIELMKLYRLANDQEFSITYACTVPNEKSNITIKSNSLKEHQYESAVILASYCCHKRIEEEKERERRLAIQRQEEDKMPPLKKFACTLKKIMRDLYII